MIAHHATLSRLVREIAPELVHSRVLRLLQYPRQGLVLEVSNSSQETVIIDIWLRPGLTTFFRRPPYWAELETARPWGEELWGAELRALTLHPIERWIEWLFHTGDRLVLLLFGTSQSGAFSIAADGTVRSCLSKAQTPYEQLCRPRYLPDWKTFDAQTPLYQALARSAYQLGTFYAREVCYRCGVEPEIPLAQLSGAERSKVEAEAHHLLQEIAQSSTALLLRRPQGPPLLSLIPLREYPDCIAAFLSLHEAVAERVRHTLRFEEFQRERTELQKRLQRYQRQVGKRLADIEVHLRHATRVELYRLWGSLLLSQPDLCQRGLEQLEVQDWWGNLQRILLNPAWTIRENAEHYFQQARRMETSLRYAQSCLPQLQQLQAELQHMQQQLEQATLRHQLRDIARRLDERFPLREVPIQQGQRARVFPLGRGFVLYVGKDAFSNDALTFGFARPHDLFLHVRGSPGAHGILRGGRKGELPPPNILQQAAAIVAYYSTARTTAMVAVSYTWRKYVRKVKGVPGAVRLEREEIVWVRLTAPGVKNR